MSGMQTKPTRRTVYPTHTCFDDAVEVIGRIVGESPEAMHSDRYVIIHAIIGRKPAMAHCWVEDQERGLAIFVGRIDGERQMLAAPRDEYRAGLHVRQATAYTIAAAVQEETRTGHCGPWKAIYRKLTRDGGARRARKGAR